MCWVKALGPACDHSLGAPSPAPMLQRQTNLAFVPMKRSKGALKNDHFISDSGIVLFRRERGPAPKKSSTMSLTPTTHNGAQENSITRSLMVGCCQPRQILQYLTGFVAYHRVNGNFGFFGSMMLHCSFRVRPLCAHCTSLLLVWP